MGLEILIALALFWQWDDLDQGVPDGFHGMQMSDERMTELLAWYDWDVDTMLRIARAESRLRVEAKNTNRNGTIDRGLLQVNSVHGFTIACLTDVLCNIWAAHQVWLRQGYGAWSTY